MLGFALRTLASVLQAGPFETTTELVLQAGELFGAVLGVFIAYQAYRGYRRNDSKPMLFIAVGFALVLGVPILLFAAYLLADVPETAIQGVVQLFEVAGLLCIIYALRMEP